MRHQVLRVIVGMLLIGAMITIAVSIVNLAQGQYAIFMGR